MHYADSNFQYSLNFVDCFSGACIIVLKETNLCNTLFAAELQQSNFILRVTELWTREHACFDHYLKKEIPEK